MKHMLIGAATALSLLAGPALAEFPEKDINGIIQWGAGGSTDLVARSVTPHATEVLGGNVILQNMTGGVGVIALKYVLQQPADGYTLLIGAENPQLYKVLGLGTEDYGDYIPINVLARGVPIIVASPDAPYNTFSELVEYVQANPGKVKVGSTGPGGLPSVVTTMLSSEVELPMTAVPYDGDGPALTALLSGAIDVMPAVLGAALENIEAGRMKPIALIDVKANDLLPGVDPITASHPAYEKYLPWGPFFGVFVKNGTPDDVVARLVDAYAAGTAHPDFTKMLEDRGYEMLSLSGDEARKFLDDWQSVSSWLVYDSGMGKHSPEEFGIPRP